MPQPKDYTDDEAVLKSIPSILKQLHPPHPLDNGDRDIAEKAQLYEFRLRGWRWTVFYWLCCVSVLAGLTGWAMVKGFPVVGQVAWANDVDKKIQKAIEPIVQEQKELKTAVQEQTIISKAFLARVAESEIRKTLKLWCEADTDELRERFEIDFERLTKEWRAATDSPGTQYKTLTHQTCRDLQREEGK